MKIAVFGTGKNYQNLKEDLRDLNSVCLIDNDKKKQGIILDGIKVVAPNEMEGKVVDYVVVLILNYSSAVKQLKGLGFKDNQILIYNQLNKIINNKLMVHERGKDIEFDCWLDNKAKDEKNVLIVSNEFSYTGVPIALMNMAVVLRNMGFRVVMSAMLSGNAVNEFKLREIPYIEKMALYYNTEEYMNSLEKVDLIIAGTLVLYDYVINIQKSLKPVLWWIHETYEKFYTGVDLKNIADNVRIYGGGERVLKIFGEYFQKIPINKLQYCIPDTGKYDCRIKKSKPVFAVIGTVCKRKAQDIVFSAVKELDETYRNKFSLLVIGREDGSEGKMNMEQHRSDIPELVWLEELSQEELEKKYSEIDVLLCVSRDDPMPIVVTQAMMHGITCVVSENVGQSEYIVNCEDGFVIKNEAVDELKTVLMVAVDDKDRMALIGKRSRKIYEREFSPEILKNRLKDIIENLEI